MNKQTGKHKNTFFEIHFKIISNWGGGNEWPTLTQLGFLGTKQYTGYSTLLLYFSLLEIFFKKNTFLNEWLLRNREAVLCYVMVSGPLRLFVLNDLYEVEERSVLTCTPDFLSMLSHMAKETLRVCAIVPGFIFNYLKIHALFPSAMACHLLTNSAWGFPLHIPVNTCYFLYFYKKSSSWLWSNISLWFWFTFP